ncbi:MAG: RluA family pseudouridine synthase [Deltaproteobacteria bacterium]|nr:RluA family pseudouridine synthase [Deltaproteobacteria bacterium]MCW5802824.1 RluA family pseudouridine synthase [Deltaproteobacteria bacterium]
MSTEAIVSFQVEAAQRADLALAKRYPDAGRRRLAELFDAGRVRIVSGGVRRRAKKGDRVAPGDAIELLEEPATGDALRPVPEDAPLVVLVERDDLIAIDKPAGMPSQPLRAGERGTAANAIAARWPECRELHDGDPRDGGLVHRLDVGTSGVLIAARTPAAHRALREAFAAGRVDKAYLAITCGRPAVHAVDAPLVQRGNRVRVDETDGLSAHTEFAVERTSATHALVRCVARTGRMHQVRAHLAVAGAPIAGDTLYGGAPLPPGAAGDTGFYLHAARVALPPPFSLVVEAPLPARFTAALERASLTPP